MKIIICSSTERIAKELKQFFIHLGHEAFLLAKDDDNQGDIKFSDVKEGHFFGADVLINLPQKNLIAKSRLKNNFEDEFISTRIDTTRYLKECLLKAKEPPKTWISFSSVGIYPKEEVRPYREIDPPGEDLTSKLILKWEEEATFPQDCKTRSVIARTGIVLSKKLGLLSKIMPFFKIGLGVTMGKGNESFPWIYQKDLFWFLNYAIHNESVEGVYNVVAPQIINSSEFSKALSTVTKKPLWLKLPKSYFRNRLGDTAEVVFARSMVFPSRLLKTGYNFRYPAIYPALVDCMSS